jgi:hypothetical protein
MGSRQIDSGRCELEAEGLQVRRDAVGDQADLAQIADQAVVQVAAEVFAEGGPAGWPASSW